MFWNIIIAALSLFVNQAANSGELSTTLFENRGLLVYTRTDLSDNKGTFHLQAQKDFANGLSFFQSISKSIETLRTPWFKSETTLDIASADPEKDRFIYGVGTKFVFLHQESGDSITNHPYAMVGVRSGRGTVSAQSEQTIRDGIKTSAAKQLELTIDRGYLLLLRGIRKQTRKTDVRSWYFEIKIPW